MFVMRKDMQATEVQEFKEGLRLAPKDAGVQKQTTLAVRPYSEKEWSCRVCRPFQCFALTCTFFVYAASTVATRA